MNIGSYKNKVHLLKFVLIGVLNTAAGYLAYGALLLAGFRYPAALAFSYLIGIIHSYAWNRIWNFRSRSPLGMESVRFVLAYAASFFINLLILTVLVDGLSIQPYIAQAGTIVFTTPVIFMLMRYWVFRKDPAK